MWISNAFDVPFIRWIQWLARATCAGGARLGRVLARLGPHSRRVAPADIARPGRQVVLDVAPTFGPKHFARLNVELQAAGDALVLNLCSAMVVLPSFFVLLASSWKMNPASRTPVRLAIRLTFDQWSGLRNMVAEPLAILGAKGVTARLFYEEQDHLPWFQGLKVPHSPEAVIRKLGTRPNQSPRWPELLESVATLFYENRSHAPSAEPLTALAEIALSHGAHDKAIAFADEALLHMPDVQTPLRCRALRILGSAMLKQGWTNPGLAVLQDSASMSGDAAVDRERAHALHELGLHALRHANYAEAEARLRDAVDLLPLEKSDFLATIHHNLAVATWGNGQQSRAEFHALTSLELRVTTASLAAERNRELLAQIREGVVVIS